MNKNHFIGLAVFIIALTVAGLIGAAVLEKVGWEQATAMVVILVGILTEAIKRR